jgi:hypothetical protein
VDPSGYVGIVQWVLLERVVVARVIPALEDAFVRDLRVETDWGPPCTIWDLLDKDYSRPPDRV